MNNRRCPRHGSRMTLLFQFYVCDQCEPPKGMPREDAVNEAIAGIDWGYLCVPPGQKEIMLPDTEGGGEINLIRMADVVFAFKNPQPVPRSPTVYIYKHRWLTDVMPKPVVVDQTTMMHMLAVGIKSHPGLRSGGHLIGTHYIPIRVHRI